MFVAGLLCIEEVEDSLGLAVVGNDVGFGRDGTDGLHVGDAVGDLPDLLGASVGMSPGSFVSGLLGLEVVGDGVGTPVGE